MTRLAPTMLVLALAGCGNDVHVRLVHEQTPLAVEECGLVARNLESFYAELQRSDDPLIYPKCINIPQAERPSSIAELEFLLAQHIVFRGVPASGTWTIWLEGFDVPDCDKSVPLLCGRKEAQPLPPAGSEVDVEVLCVAKPLLWPDGVPRSFWGDTTYPLCKFK